MILELHSHDQSVWMPLTGMLKQKGITFHAVPNSNILVVSNHADPALFDSYTSLISKKTLIDSPYQLASKQWKNTTTFNVKGIQVGQPSFNIIAGPCSIESEEQIFATAEFLSKQGVKFIRGGAYKPRTSPYSFRGLGKKGLEMIREAANQYDLRVVSEIMDLQYLDEMLEFVDVLQVGSRNMQNFQLLHELGHVKKPVLLKRGMSAKTKEWLLAAEYILSGGNEEVILCERGIRGFDPDTRNVMDIGVIPLIKELSHLPVIADPSHGTGSADRVLPLALAATAAGADGLMIEIHPDPEKALSDAQQTITFNQFEKLMQQVPLLLTLNKQIPDSQTDLLKLQSL